MALFECIECGTQVSEHAANCPQCGCPVDVIKKKKGIMLYKDKEYQLSEVSELLKAGNDEQAIGILEKKLGTDICGASLIIDVIKFNNYEVPYNFIMCLHRLADHEISREHVEENKPKCPICGSTNIGPLSTFERLLGAFSMGRSRLSWVRVECKNCGHMW